MAFAAFAAVLALAALVAATPAAAKQKSCAEQVVNDWYGNGRVDKIYPLHCYREAIASLPQDITTYSDAKVAIQRALAAAALGKPDPGGPTGPGGVPLGPSGKPVLLPGEKPIAIRNTADDVVALPSQPTATAAQTTTAGPSSVPVPLLVLAGLALLLLAAGGAGYVARRIQSRRSGPPPASG